MDIITYNSLFIFRHFIESSCDSTLHEYDLNHTEYIANCQEKISTAYCDRYNAKVDQCNQGIMMRMTSELDSCFQIKKRRALNAICDELRSKYLPLGLDHMLVVNSTEFRRERFEIFNSNSKMLDFESY